MIAAVIAPGCENNAQTTADRSERPEPRTLRSIACSDVEVSDGQYRQTWLVKDQSNEPSPTLSLSPKDFDVGQDGSIFLIDRRAAQITHLNSSGTVARQWGGSGDGPGEFRQPIAVAVVNNRIYTGDQRGRLNVFSLQGTLIRSAQIFTHAITDVTALPNGNIVVVTDAQPSEGDLTYVTLTDSMGQHIRAIAQLSRDHRRVRPLLGHETNPVRITLGPEGRFALWYPMDNYVQVFDSAGRKLTDVKGCMPRELEDSYARQARSRSHWQSFVPLTMGVRLQGDQHLLVASFHMIEDNALIRVRRYNSAGQELAARDFDFGISFGFDRVEFLNDSTLILVNTYLPDSGVRRVNLR